MRDAQPLSLVANDKINESEITKRSRIQYPFHQDQLKKTERILGRF